MNPSSSVLEKRLFPGLSVGGVLLLAIMALSLGLHLLNLQALGNANEYYTAAAQSMLQSWHNFFFVAAEPGASVTVDKPPLGLWVEALFAAVLGVSGFSVSLPNIVAGVFSLPLLYGMVKKHLGTLAGLIAALSLALTPVFVATNRNNTMDGMLVFTLLLAAWAFVAAAESGKLSWLLAGALMVGLGFNIKMLQAFLPLPAFYALYFFSAKQGWLRKALYLGLCSALLLVVSFSWAVIVDLTPVDQRPYIGSSSDNTVMGLIFGHNGISRLGRAFGAAGPATPNRPGGNSAQPQNPNPGGQAGAPPPAALQACAGLSQGEACSFTQPNGNTLPGTCVVPPSQSSLACAPQNRPGAPGAFGDGPNASPDPNPGSTPVSSETGSPGVGRFFTAPLSKQMSWLLPLALLSLAWVFGARLRLPLQEGLHRALLLWGGWLLTCVVFFSMVSGIFHAYYAIMLAPALGGMVGLGFAQFWAWMKSSRWGEAALMAALLLTLAFQLFSAAQYGDFSFWMWAAPLLLGLGGLLMRVSRRMGFSLLLLSVLLLPGYWTLMTSLTGGDRNLPTAYAGRLDQAQPGGALQPRPGGALQPRPGGDRAVDTHLLQFLQTNTQDVTYLLAVPSSQQGANLVLASGRPVLYMGGFGGQDEVVSVSDLEKMVSAGELRYVLYGGQRGNKIEISRWLAASCTLVPGLTLADAPGGRGPGGDQTLSLYECR